MRTAALVADVPKCLTCVLQVAEDAPNKMEGPQDEQPERASKRKAQHAANGDSRAPAQGTDAGAPPTKRLLRPREGPGKGVKTSQQSQQRDDKDDDEFHLTLSSDTSWSSGYRLSVPHQTTCPPSCAHGLCTGC